MSAPRRDRGATIPLVAILLPVLIIMTSFAVDLGRQRASRRSLQADVDVISLDMVRLADGRTTLDIYNDPDTDLALQRSADRNDIPLANIVEVVWGEMSADGRTFVPHHQPQFAPSDPTLVATAVKITATESTDYFFQPGSGTATRSAVAEVYEEEEAYFKIGSFLVSVTPASNTMVGAVISSVVPGAELLSYDGLVGADVTLADLMTGLTVLSPNAGLDTPISYQDLMLATITALEAEGGNTAAITLLEGMASTAPTVDQITLGEVLDASASGGTPAGTATYDVLGLLTGAVFLVDTEHAVSIPSSEVNILGVGTVDMQLGLIEAPQTGGPNVGDTASTGQFDLTITPHITLSTSQTIDLCSLSSTLRNLLDDLLGGTLDFLTCLLGGTLNRLLELEIDATNAMQFRAAGAIGTLTDIDCDASPGITVTTDPIPIELTSQIDITVTGSLAGSSLGDLARVSIPASATSLGTAGPERFDHPTQFGPPPRRVGSNPLGLGGLINVSGANVSLLNVDLGPVVNPLLTPLTTELNNVLGEIDTQLLPPIANALGLGLGGADLTALSMECGQGNPKLVD